MMKNQVSKRNVVMSGYKDTRGFTLVELMVVVMIIGILAATAIGSFKNYVERGKTTEAMQGVARLAQAEAEYYTKNVAFLNAGPANIPPTMAKVITDFSTDPNWALLNFNFSEAILYGYQATVTSPTSVDCEAQGDIDGNGITSLFRRIVSFNERVEVGELAIFGELD